MAIKYYNKALKLDANSAGAYNNRGEAYLHKGKYDRAIKDFDQALKLNPNLVEAMANIGDAYLAKNDNKNALKWFKEARKRKDQLPNKGEKILKSLEKLKHRDKTVGS
ncbi:hypothetical protein ES706_00030 [subsurface metagenome]